MADFWRWVCPVVESMLCLCAVRKARPYAILMASNQYPPARSPALLGGLFLYNSGVNEVIKLRISAELKKEVGQVAEYYGMSISEYVRHLIVLDHKARQAEKKKNDAR